MQGRRAARALGLAIAAAVLLAAPAMAADITVTTTGDTAGTCPSPASCTTVRAAFAEAGRSLEDDTIHVPAGVTQLTSALSPPMGVTIAGAGAGQTTIKASASDRVFNVLGEMRVIFTSLTMSGGVEPDTSGGGSLRVGNSARVTLDHVHITGGSASIGAGIMNDAATELTIEKSLIDGNTATGQGGGIVSVGGVGASALTIRDTTITRNSASQGGGVALLSNALATTRLERVTIARNDARSADAGGLYLGDAGPVQIGGSIVASNTGLVTRTASDPSNCGAIKPGDLGGNVESVSDCAFTAAGDRQNVDPGLGALTGDGGQTQVLPLVASSPAVDLAGACAPAADQRDVARPQGAACDAGAYELVPAPPPPGPTPVPTATPTPTPTPAFDKTVVVTTAGGTIRVRCPGDRAYVPLNSTKGIPLGCSIDSRDGEVLLTAINKKGGGARTARFFDGIFKVTQTRTTTDLTLNEDLASCKAKGAASSAAAKKKTRKLWGDGSGSFRTRGQYSSATVRGTKWLVQDSCAGTLTRVSRGVVTVRDEVRRRTLILRAGRHYLARPKKP